MDGASDVATRMLGLQLGRTVMAVGWPGVNGGFEAMGGRFPPDAHG
jgi:hypothetical protein